ncbi:unnamed protein product [Schistosoma mattheei]|uniref:Uncharacterized protein n=1 Tax=Schistosoma mattheei TaxID=31246 RepID=A0A183PV29_9TREM|nr:unnamed protein product [Schistosoma mattheei]
MVISCELSRLLRSYKFSSMYVRCCHDYKSGKLNHWCEFLYGLKRLTYHVHTSD